MYDVFHQLEAIVVILETGILEIVIWSWNKQLRVT